MDLLTFAGGAVALIAFVTLPWPLNVPLMALAYKVRRGSEPIDFETGEFWTRAALGAGATTGLSLVLVVLGYLLIVGAEFPGGATWMLLLVAYLPAVVACVTWSFGLDELLDGLTVALIYVLLPGLPLLLVGRFLGLWRYLAGQLPWLLTA